MGVKQPNTSHVLTYKLKPNTTHRITTLNETPYLFKTHIDYV